MKILRIITRCNGGGPVSQVTILNRYIPNSILIYGSISKGEVDASYLAEGLRTYYISELQREISPIKDFKAFLKIYDIIKFERPDIIHTHTPFSVGWEAMLSAKFFDIPIIGTHHTFINHYMLRAYQPGMGLSRTQGHYLSGHSKT